MASKHTQESEMRYYRDVVGFEGLFLFAENLQFARIMVVANKGIMPIDRIAEKTPALPGVCRIGFTKEGAPVKRAYCAFRKNDNNSYYANRFIEMLRESF